MFLLISAPDNQIYFCGVKITSGDPRIFSGSVSGPRGCKAVAAEG
jgi:hypothetical protein